MRSQRKQVVVGGRGQGTSCSVAATDTGPSVVGVVGRLGTGKSTVAALLAGPDGTLLKADEVSRALFAPGTKLWPLLQRAFPGCASRREIAARAFAEPRALRRLQRVTYPLLRRALRQRIAAAPAALVVVEAANLIELLPRGVITAWVEVRAREAVALRRARKSSAWDAATRRRCRDCQRRLPRPPRALVITNNGTRRELARRVGRLLALRGTADTSRLLRVAAARARLLSGKD